MSMQVGRERTIPCAFCKGKGADPFDLLRPAARCDVCHGAGRVTVADPSVPCVFCQGTGSHNTFGCPVCRGTGVVPALPYPMKVCPACQGRTYEVLGGLVCLTCRGARLVPDGQGAKGRRWPSAESAPPRRIFDR
ncbi:MAG: hypothetical protein FJ279_36285 [Planctomycetes bacterium]|nr:hypothetical protein [Planctomycetota bacterium]